MGQSRWKEERSFGGVGHLLVEWYLSAKVRSLLYINIEGARAIYLVNHQICRT